MSISRIILRKASNRQSLICSWLYCLHFKHQLLHHFIYVPIQIIIKYYYSSGSMLKVRHLYLRAKVIWANPAMGVWASSPHHILNSSSVQDEVQVLQSSLSMIQTCLPLRTYFCYSNPQNWRFSNFKGIILSCTHHVHFTSFLWSWCLYDWNVVLSPIHWISQTHGVWTGHSTALQPSVFRVMGRWWRGVWNYHQPGRKCGQVQWLLLTLIWERFDVTLLWT